MLYKIRTKDSLTLVLLLHNDYVGKKKKNLHWLSQYSIQSLQGSAKLKSKCLKQQRNYDVLHR